MNDKHSRKYGGFNIIHYYLSPNSAVTVDGKTVKREEKIWMEEFDDQNQVINGRFVMCAPYDEHFVYKDPMWKLIKGRWSTMCTCGSVAIIVGYNPYADMSSPSTLGTIRGEMLVCKWHLDNGVHQTGGRKWI